jgi:hypothetical protein
VGNGAVGNGAVGNGAVGNGAVGNGAVGNGAVGNGAVGAGVDARDGADARDRLLAMLLPDPEGALAMVAAAEAARDAVQREGRRLDAAVEELVAQGLSREQVLALLDLP